MPNAEWRKAKDYIMWKGIPQKSEQGPTRKNTGPKTEGGRLKDQTRDQRLR